MTENTQPRRRDLLAAGAGLLILNARTIRGSQANSAVRVGLLGCGGRGTGVAAGMEENAGARVTALADLFEDQIAQAKPKFKSAAETFTGAHVAEQIANSKNVDAIYIATPPYFHTEHLEIVVNAGKHVYVEKPIGIDVARAKRAIEIGKKAQGRLSLEVGFQIRKAPPFVELVRRIHAGALGEIASGEAFYFCPFIDRPAFAEATPAVRRLRNWIYDRVLSGDIIVEQNIHVIDICNWVLRGHPVKAAGTGGRKGRTEPGDCWSHFDVVFTYPNDVHVSFASCQFGKVAFDASERFLGTLGSSSSPYAGTIGITGEQAWTWGAGQTQPAGGQFSATGAFSDNLAQADPEKQKSFIQSIVTGKFHNESVTGAESALTAMLARRAAYTGREVSWDELLASNEQWDAKLDVATLV